MKARAKYGSIGDQDVLKISNGYFCGTIKYAKYKCEKEFAI